MRWLNETARRWWPLIACTIAACVIGTLIYVVDAVAYERDMLDEQNASLQEQNERLGEIVERDRRVDAERVTQVADALIGAEAILREHFAIHDENVALKLNELLARIEVLLGRPVGPPIAAATAHPKAPSTPTVAPAPKAAPAPKVAPAPTTTTPNQKKCAKRPNAKNC